MARDLDTPYGLEDHVSQRAVRSALIWTFFFMVAEPSPSNSTRQHFRENAINEKVLPNLTAEDLKDMGVDICRASPECISMPSPLLRAVCEPESAFCGRSLKKL